MNIQEYIKQCSVKSVDELQTNRWWITTKNLIFILVKSVMCYMQSEIVIT